MRRIGETRIMSRTAELLKLLDGSHVMDEDGLRNYHVAKRVVNANRKPKALLGSRLTAVRQELKNYRVMVSIRDNDIRVYRPDTNQEWYLSGTR